MSWFHIETETESASIGVVVVKDASRSERPQFKRTYTATVGAGDRLAKVHVEIKWFLGSRHKGYGTLTQLNGKYILFDIESVADKILDRSLALEVEAVAKEILKLDRDFIKNEPNVFIDEVGRTWTR